MEERLKRRRQKEKTQEATTGHHGNKPMLGAKLNDSRLVWLYSSFIKSELSICQPMLGRGVVNLSTNGWGGVWSICQPMVGGGVWLLWRNEACIVSAMEHECALGV